MSAGNLFNALIALTGLVMVGTLFSAAMIWFALRISGGGEVKASAESFGAGRAEMGADLRVVGSQTSIQVQNSTNSKPPIQSGQAAK